MPTEKRVKGVIIPRHDTMLNWSKALNFVPAKGELIVYDADSAEVVASGYDVSSIIIGTTLYGITPSDKPRFKFGNGVDNVNVLPFAAAQADGYGMVSDQEFNPQSKNPQSGKAVAQAINDFANAIKKSEIGSLISVNDVSPVEHNLDVKVRNKNLIPYPYFQEAGTINGITFSDNKDGSISINGTAQDNAFFGFVDKNSDQLYINKGQKYTLNILPVTASYTTIYAYITESDGTQHFEIGDSITFTANSSGYVSCSLVVAKGFTADNLLVKPQLELGGTVTEFTPYVSDFSLIDISRCGKNLAMVNSVNFPTTSFQTVFEGRITGDFTLSWKHNLTDVAYPTSALFKWTFEDGTYNYSAAVSTEILYANISGTITKIEVTNYCEAAGGSVYDIQLEVSTTATDYESYIGMQTATANIDGTVEGLTSVSPNMTVFTNNDGVKIDCTYNADTKLYIDAIKSEIAEQAAAIVDASLVNAIGTGEVTV